MAARRILLTVFTTLALLAATGSITTPAGAREVAGRFVVRGDVEHRLRLSVADLEALPQQTVTVDFLAGSTPQTRTYTGPLLLDVLNLAGPDFDPTVRNDKLGFAVVVTGPDDDRAVVAWGEFDPDFEAKPILLTTTEDGVSLAEAGPRLVVPGDLRGGRYVTNVVSVRLKSID